MGGVFDMSRAMHITDKMQNILDVYSYRGIRKFLIVLKSLYRSLKSVDGVTFLRIQKIFIIFQRRIDGSRVPCGSELVLRSMTIVIHPFGEMYDGISAKVFFNLLLCRRFKMVFCDLGNGFVAFPAPSECRGGGCQTYKNYKDYPFHLLQCAIIYVDAKLTFYENDSNILKKKVTFTL